MKMICDVPDEVIASVRDHTWLGSSVLEKMIVKGIPLDKIIAEIEQMDFDFNDYYDHTNEIVERVCKVIDKYKAESEEANNVSGNDH